MNALAMRVAARFQLRQARPEWDGKIVGPTFRLQWSRATGALDELPQKGKKKLRQASLQNPGYGRGGQVNMDAFIPENILRSAHVESSDTYESVKSKIQKAMTEAADQVLAALGENPDAKHWQWLKTLSWNEKEVYFTAIMPEGMEPFTVEAEDFTVAVEWTSFKAYSPNSDFQQSDPHYTQIAESSPQAARKLYMILKENPAALKGVSWNKFDPWLKANKIGYKFHFSQWS